MNKIRITTLTVCAVMGFSAHAQNLLLNGSFELPVIPVNTFQAATPTSWTWSGGTPGFVFNGSVPYGYGGFAAIWPAPKDAQQFADIGPDSFGPLSQTFTITNQALYVLSWFDSAGQSGGLTTAPYLVRVMTGALQTVSSNRFDAYNATNAWVARSILLTLGPGTTPFSFQACSPMAALMD